MADKRNILFIMCDQLRQDYLSCYGHKSLTTPNIDNLAKRGVLFTNAYCQAPLCGPSRASFYTGRYQSSHGVMGNSDAIQLGEKYIGDYLATLGYRSAVVGKTHSRRSQQDMANAAIDPQSDFAKNANSGGFEPYEVHEGLYPDPILPQQLGYHRFLKKHGYPSDNPWDRCANSGLDADDKHHSGWALRSSPYPADIDEQHSETAFCTQRAMDFINENDAQPWCLHLSYIKPHWPIIAPAPYHNMYQSDDVQALRQHPHELTNNHPVLAAFRQQEYSRVYSDPSKREQIIPVYMGLVKQIDDHLGKLFAFLEQKQLLDSTLIVFTADHGDYLGDHYLGEKDLFHDPSVKIPLIVVDPSAAADTTRGTTNDDLIEAIDIAPTFIDFAGGRVCQQRLEGYSLLPTLQKPTANRSTREVVISEIDYSERGPRQLLGLPPQQCRATMVCNKQWKYIYYQGFAPQLFDLTHDPDEFFDLGTSPDHHVIRQQLFQALFDWRYTLKNRVGIDHDHLQEQCPERDEQFGIIIGRW